MKHVFLCIMLLASIQLYGIEKLKEHPKPPEKITLLVGYLFFKEMLYAHCILPFWLDTTIANQSAIYCCKCTFKLNSLYAYGCFVAMGDMKKIATLKRLWYKKDEEKLKQFLLKISIKEEFECPCCLDYCGWYLK